MAAGTVTAPSLILQEVVLSVLARRRTAQGTARSPLCHREPRSEGDKVTPGSPGRGCPLFPALKPPAVPGAGSQRAIWHRGGCAGTAHGLGRNTIILVPPALCLGREPENPKWGEMPPVPCLNHPVAGGQTPSPRVPAPTPAARAVHSGPQPLIPRHRGGPAHVRVPRLAPGQD